MGAKLTSASGRYTIAQNADINVTPFVDVMLVLLIIFMVSIPVATTSIRLDIPPADGSKSRADPVFVSVMGPDDIYVAGQRTTLPALAGAVAAALRASDPHTPPADQRVLVRGDKDIDYADFVRVLNELQQNGYSHVGLINEDVG